MPAVKYDNKFTGESIGPRNFASPRKISEPKAWVRVIRKVIPEVPLVIELGGEDWMIGEWIVDTRILVIPLISVSGEKASLAIDRTAPMF